MDVIKVADVPAHYTLLQNGSEVSEALEFLGTDAVADGYTYLFVDVQDGDYVGAYGSYGVSLDDNAYMIL